MRYVIYGAGAIGGGIGGCLAHAGLDVTLVARGAHLATLQADGLELRHPAGSERLSIRAVADAGQVGLRAGDVVVLAVKSQDTAAALEDLAAAGEPELGIVCAQNGVDNERQALRRFARVYGMCVLMPATHLEPGVVELRDGPVHGVLDLGRYPGGGDPVSDRIAADLRAAGFGAVAHQAIMGRKYRKLLANLSNALDAASGPDGRHSFLADAARREAWACFRAAGIEVAPEREDLDRRTMLPRTSAPMANRAAPSSSWQSLARGTTIEADYLNGEIVLLGRLWGIATPVNELLADLAGSLARTGAAPGSVALEAVEADAVRRGVVRPT